ncbi:Fe-S oxidoreductase [Schumannella soli]|uniref:Fe-S oxidoreductase n=1 Tax=Schumannella soli TaxID=2590779 RepID=A0A506Y3I5_9MICO|nr:Fe-S oxidoreductase [Schumannella soli]
MRWLRALLLWRPVALAGYGVATAAGWIWGAALLLSPAPRSEGGVVVCAGLPSWAFGRGGTTIGAIYLTRDNVAERVLRHEAVHRAQWRRYGLAFIPLYFAAGHDARGNRFEIEAGLADGGYADT